MSSTSTGRRLMKPKASTSRLTHLEAAYGGRIFPADELATYDVEFGSPLLAQYDLQSVKLTARTLVSRRGSGMWRWREILPVRSSRNIIYLGEGDTPLLPCQRLGSFLGVTKLRLKCEGLNPTGSFKARGMAVAVSRGLELGVRSFVAPSAGNAGGALAAYGSACGAQVTVVMPADAPMANQAEVVMCGGRLLLVEGLIDDCGWFAARIAEETGGFNVSTLKEPYRIEGKKTMGLELALDCAWRLPDAVIYPTGGGTGLIGMWKAFDELEALGLIGGHRPRMIVVQAAGCAPLVRAFSAGAATADLWSGATTRASGIRVPGTIGDQLILGIVRASGGVALAVSEDDITSIQLAAGRLGAGYVSPETAAALASIPELVASGAIGRADDTVVFDTGIGQKYPAPQNLPKPLVVHSDEEDVQAVLARMWDGHRIG